MVEGEEPEKKKRHGQRKICPECKEENPVAISLCKKCQYRFISKGKSRHNDPVPMVPKHVPLQSTIVKKILPKDTGYVPQRGSKQCLECGRGNPIAMFNCKFCGNGFPMKHTAEKTKRLALHRAQKAKEIALREKQEKVLKDDPASKAMRLARAHKAALASIIARQNKTPIPTNQKQTKVSFASGGVYYQLGPAFDGL
mmetsp:Transcript_13481/g.24171  ORF Transcript_13481/g.24171 Transcript_13481/m.24171 type:complete len:198 (+) Transcript_13481:80-673(+)